MEKLNKKQKIRMILDSIILSYKVGNSSDFFIGKPLSHFDFEKVFNYIKELNQENIEQGGDDFFEYQPNYPFN